MKFLKLYHLLKNITIKLIPNSFREILFKCTDHRRTDVQRKKERKDMEWKGCLGEAHGSKAQDVVLGWGTETWKEKSLGTLTKQRFFICFLCQCSNIPGRFLPWRTEAQRAKCIAKTQKASSFWQLIKEPNPSQWLPCPRMLVQGGISVLKTSTNKEKEYQQYKGLMLVLGRTIYLFPT